MRERAAFSALVSVGVLGEGDSGAFSSRIEPCRGTGNEEEAEGNAGDGKGLHNGRILAQGF